MGRQGGARGPAAPGNTPPPGSGAGCREGKKQRKGLALDSSALPHPPRDLARKGGWGGAAERPAVLAPLFPAPQPKKARAPLDVAQTRGVAASPDAEPLPAKRGALQKGWLEPRPATQRRGPTPAGRDTAEVTPSQGRGEGFLFSPSRSPRSWRLLAPSRSPPPTLCSLRFPGTETPWMGFPGGTLAPRARRGSAPPLPAGAQPRCRWPVGGARGEPARGRRPALQSPAPRPALPAPGPGARPAGATRETGFCAVSRATLASRNSRFTRKSRKVLSVGDGGDVAVPSAPAPRGCCCRRAATNSSSSSGLLFLFQVIIIIIHDSVALFVQKVQLAFD